MKIIDKPYGKVIIGKNARENWGLIDNGEPDDIWFHLSDLPSCHIICIPNIEFGLGLEKEHIIDIAKICKENSKYKNDKKIKIIYTKLKNITKGKCVGEAIVKSNNYDIKYIIV